jgi:hypothetical protein
MLKLSQLFTTKGIMNTQKGSAHLIIITGLAVLLLGALGFIFWQNFMKTDTKQSVDSSMTKTTEKEDNKEVAVSEDIKTGIVSGKAIYPSEVYPSDFKVCAVSEATKQEVVCDKTMESGEYSISLTPGNYLVVASSGSLKGYYDGYMKSGMTNEICDASNHTPLVVSVAQGSSQDGIDAGNFYYEPSNC